MFHWKLLFDDSRCWSGPLILCCALCKQLIILSWWLIEANKLLEAEVRWARLPDFKREWCLIYWGRLLHLHKFASICHRLWEGNVKIQFSMLGHISAPFPCEQIVSYFLKLWLERMNIWYCNWMIWWCWEAWDVSNGLLVAATISTTVTVLHR